MDVETFNKNLLSVAILASLLTLTACGGGGGGSAPAASETPQSNQPEPEPEPVVYNYTFTVIAPDSYLSSVEQSNVQNKLWLQKPLTELNWNNFALVTVDAAGIVQEQIALEESQLTQDVDGNWTLSVTDRPLNIGLVLVVSPQGEPAINLYEALPVSTLYTPITNNNFTLDVASSLAYQRLLTELNDTQSFQELGFDQVDSSKTRAFSGTINATREFLTSWTLTEKYDENAYSSIEQLLEGLTQEQLTSLNSELSLLENFSTVSALDDATSDASISFLYTWAAEDFSWWGYFDEEYKVSGPVSGLFRNEFTDPNQAGLSQATHADFGPDVLLLSDGEWLELRYLERNIEISEDKIVVKSSNEVNSSSTLEPTQSVSLEGINIKEFLASLPDLHDGDSPTSLDPAAQLVSQDAVFSADARFHRYNHTVNTFTRMAYKACDSDTYLNCEFSHFSYFAQFESENGFKAFVLNDLISEPNTLPVYVELPVELPDRNLYSAALLNDLSRSVEIYRQQDWGQYDPLAEGNWKYVTMETGQEAIEITATFFDDNKEVTYYLIEAGNGIYKAEKILGSQHPIRSFNRTAINDISSAVEVWPNN